MESVESQLNSFDIYCLLKNNSLLEQAKVEENKSNFTVTLNQLNPAISRMDTYLKDLFNLMMKYEHAYPYNQHIYETQKYFFENNEFVKGIIFHRVLMRKGAYFYVLQQSDRGLRFLLYTMNRIHHSSIALGVSMIIPKVNDEIKSMKDELNKLTMKQVEELQITNLSELIKQDKLYFL